MRRAGGGERRGKFADVGTEGGEALPRRGVRIVVRAAAHAHRGKGLRQPRDRRRHLCRAGREACGEGHEPLWTVARASGPDGKARRVELCQQGGFVHVVVENDIAHVMPPQGVQQSIRGVDRKGLVADLKAQVADRIGPVGGDGGHDLLRVCGAAQTALPRPALRQKGGRDAMDGHIAVTAAQAVDQGKGGRGARRDVTLERVAVQIDDAWHEVVTGQVDGRARPVRDATVRKGQVAGLQRAVPQHAGAGQSQMGDRGHGASAADDVHVARHRVSRVTGPRLLLQSAASRGRPRTRSARIPPRARRRRC